MTDTTEPAALRAASFGMSKRGSLAQGKSVGMDRVRKISLLRSSQA